MGELLHALGGCVVGGVGWNEGVEGMRNSINPPNILSILHLLPYSAYRELGIRVVGDRVIVEGTVEIDAYNPSATLTGKPVKGRRTLLKRH